MNPRFIRYKKKITKIAYLLALISGISNNRLCSHKNKLWKILNWKKKHLNVSHHFHIFPNERERSFSHLHYMFVRRLWLWTRSILLGGVYILHWWSFFLCLTFHIWSSFTHVLMRFQRCGRHALCSAGGQRLRDKNLASL